MARKMWMIVSQAYYLLMFFSQLLLVSIILPLIPGSRFSRLMADNIEIQNFDLGGRFVR